MYIVFCRLLHRTVFLIQRRLPNPYTKRVSDIDGILTVLEGEAFGITQVISFVISNILCQVVVCLYDSCLLFFWWYWFWLLWRRHRSAIMLCSLVSRRVDFC